MGEMGLREWMAERGATEQQLNAKVVNMVEEAMTDDAVTSSATAKAMVAGLVKSVERADAKADALARGVGRLEDRYGKVLALLEEAERDARGAVIHSEQVKDGVLAFRKVLEAVRETFGEDRMSDAVMCAAIEAASYGMWRAVMGPKDNVAHAGRAVL